VIFEPARRQHGGILRQSIAPTRFHAVWFVDRLDFFNCTLWLGDEARRAIETRVCRPDIWMQAHSGLVPSSSGAPRGTVGGQVHAPDTVLGMSLSA